MVERCVRDAEVACSNHVASIFRPVGQAVKTTPSHGVNPGSIPGLVERCVRDAEVACSNHVASIFRPVGQAVKTTPSHGVNPGSIPGQVTDFCVMQKSFLFQKKLRLIKSKYSARTAMPVPNLN